MFAPHALTHLKGRHRLSCPRWSSSLGTTSFQPQWVLSSRFHRPVVWDDVVPVDHTLSISPDTQTPPVREQSSPDSAKPVTKESKLLPPRILVKCNANVQNMPPGFLASLTYALPFCLNSVFSPFQLKPYLFFLPAEIQLSLESLNSIPTLCDEVFF